MDTNANALELAKTIAGLNGEQLQAYMRALEIHADTGMQAPKKPQPSSYANKAKAEKLNHYGHEEITLSFKDANALFNKVTHGTIDGVSKNTRFIHERVPGEDYGFLWAYSPNKTGFSKKSLDVLCFGNKWRKSKARNGARYVNLAEFMNGK